MPAAIKKLSKSKRKFYNPNTVGNERYNYEIWCKALSIIKNGGSTAKAAEITGIARATLFNWRNRSPKHLKDWQDAQEGAADIMEDAAFTRAVHGVEKPVFGRVATEDGSSMEQIGTTIEYSDTLLMFLLKGRRSSVFRDNVTVGGDPNSPILHGIKVMFVQGGAPQAEQQQIEHQEADE